MEKPWRAVRQLDVRQQWGLGVLLAGLVVAGVVWCLYAPLLVRIGAARATSQDLRVKIGDMAYLEQDGQSAEDVDARYRALARRVGQDQSLAGVLASLSQLARDHRLELVSVQPLPDEAQQPVVSMGPLLALRPVPVHLQVVGRYRQFGEFLSGVGASPFLSSVRRLELANVSAGGAQLRAELELLVYIAEQRELP